MLGRFFSGIKVRWGTGKLGQRSAGAFVQPFGTSILSLIFLKRLKHLLLQL
jgi:hypothetical protein